MKPAIIALLLVLIAGCTQGEPEQAVSGTQELVLTDQDLAQLGMARDAENEDLVRLGIIGNASNCAIGEEYSICSYSIDGLNGTEVILEVKRFANAEDLNGAYQYESSHLFSAEGLISQNDFGDQSTFRVNSESDYGGEFNEEGIFYYHLWFTKDLYLIHITSGGSEDAKEYLASAGERILAKFG